MNITFPLWLYRLLKSEANKQNISIATLIERNIKEIYTNKLKEEVEEDG